MEQEENKEIPKWRGRVKWDGALLAPPHPKPPPPPNKTNKIKKENKRTKNKKKNLNPKKAEG